MEKKSTYKPNTAISIYKLFQIFPNEETARKYLEEKRWGGILTNLLSGIMKEIKDIPLWRELTV